MKYTKIDFLRSPGHTIEVDEELCLEESDLFHHTQVRSVPKVHITGTLQFDGSSLVTSDLELDGILIVPDSITSEDLEVEFDTESQETYSFADLKDADEDMIVVKNDTIDILPAVLEALIYEAPMSLSRLPRDKYPKGDGWQLLSDQDEQEKEIDPRWAKLSELNLDDD